MKTKNYGPKNLFPIYCKVFKRFISNSIFNYFFTSDFFASCQSGFIPRDFFASPVIVHHSKIFTYFNCDPPLEVKAIILNTPSL